MSRRRVVVWSLLGLVALVAWIAGMVVTDSWSHGYSWVAPVIFMVPIVGGAVTVIAILAGPDLLDWWRGLPSERELHQAELEARAARIAELEEELFPVELTCWTCGKLIPGTSCSARGPHRMFWLDGYSLGDLPRHLDCPPPKDPKLRLGAK